MRVSNETIWINDKNIRKQKYNDIINHGNHEQLVNGKICSGFKLSV